MVFWQSAIIKKVKLISKPVIKKKKKKRQTINSQPESAAVINSVVLKDKHHIRGGFPVDGRPRQRKLN